MEKQLTAVEWLAKNLKNFPHVKHSQLFRDLVEKAKEMEKEQLKDAYEKGKKYKKPIKDSNPIWLNSKPYK